MTTQATTGYELRQQGGLQVLAWPALDRYPVDALVTTRHGGVSAGAYATLNLSFGVGDRPEDVLENRRRAATALGAGLGDFVFGKPGARRRGPGGGPRGPGRGRRGRRAPGWARPTPWSPATPARSWGCWSPTACRSSSTTPAAHVLACVHAGWRGTVAGVTGAALEAMAALGTRPGDVIAGIGPAIGPDRYQVGEEVAAAVRECFGERAPQVIRPDGTGRWLFDLWSANRLLLREAGVAERAHPRGRRPHRRGLLQQPFGPALRPVRRCSPGCARGTARRDRRGAARALLVGPARDADRGLGARRRGPGQPAQAGDAGRGGGAGGRPAVGPGTGRAAGPRHRRGRAGSAGRLRGRDQVTRHQPVPPGGGGTGGPGHSGGRRPRPVAGRGGPQPGRLHHRDQGQEQHHGDRGAPAAPVGLPVRGRRQHRPAAVGPLARLGVPGTGSSRRPATRPPTWPGRPRWSR